VVNSREMDVVRLIGLAAVVALVGAGTACNSWCGDQTVNACTPDCTADSARCPGYSACLTELNQCAGRDSLDCLDDT